MGRDHSQAVTETCFSVHLVFKTHFKVETWHNPNVNNEGCFAVFQTDVR